VIKVTVDEDRWLHDNCYVEEGENRGSIRSSMVRHMGEWHDKPHFPFGRREALKRKIMEEAEKAGETVHEIMFEVAGYNSNRGYRPDAKWFLATTVVYHQ